MLVHRFPDIYNTTNTIGAIANILCVMVLILFVWRKHAQAKTATDWPTWNPLHYLKKDQRHKFNPVWFMLCFLAAYVVLINTLTLTTTLFSPVNVRGSLSFIAGDSSFASGVLFFIITFLLLTLFFPGNGKPTRQLELIFPAFALQHMFNRLACFFGVCCFGVPFRFGLIFPEGTWASLAYGIGARVFPTQLLEATIMLLCFGLILLLQHRGKRTLPIFPLVFGATGFMMGFVMSTSLPSVIQLQPLFGFTNPTAFTHLLIFFIGAGFLFLQIMQSKRKNT